jgi:two-component system, LuxR family, sensor kinase FixL
MPDSTGSDLGRQLERETTMRVMTAYVAHELNHPLGTIINLVNTLSRNLARSVVRPQEIDEQLRIIKEEAIRATSIIKQLRLLSGHRQAEKYEFCLADVCRESIARLRPLADAKQVRVHLWIGTGKTQIYGVKELIGTALYNLLVNSVAALDDDAIAHRMLVVRIVAKTDDTVAIQVIDNGCGMPDAIRDHIFEPFVTTKEDGSGLGLAIAGDIVRWHHGQLYCTPRRRGTCMEMVLPVN